MATKTKSERFELRVDEDQLSQIDAWAAEQSDQPTRAEAVRRLLAFGLSAGSKRAVHFSDGEKMLMLMMADLFKSLKVKADNSNPEFLADVIYGGHYWAPKWDMQGVFHDHIDNPKDVEYVVDVLDMWSFIEDSFGQLSSAEQELVKKQTNQKGDIKFDGFDGNEESNQRSIALFLVNKIGRFTKFKNRELNTHFSTYDRYRKMLELFEPIRVGQRGGLLDSKQLIALLEI
jgi:uncharacterized protein YfbU (UPF0304 family)